MPIEFAIDPTCDLVLTYARGRIDGAELVDYYRRLREHRDFRGDLNEIFDVSGAVHIDLSAEHVRALSQTTLPFTRKGQSVKVAIVAPADLAFGMSRMYEMLQAESVNEIRVFRDRAAAEHWIGAASERG